MDDVQTRLMQLGFEPSVNIDELSFQLLCLEKYERDFRELEYYLDTYIKNSTKPIIVFYDSLPMMTQCYLDDPVDVADWITYYEENKENYSDYGVDLLFIAELLRGEFFRRQYEIDRDFDVDSVLDITDRLGYVFKDGCILSCDMGVEERALVLKEQIDEVLE